MLTSFFLTVFTTRNHPTSIMENVKSPQNAPAKK
jgi:hypothetical protein